MGERETANSEGFTVGISLFDKLCQRKQQIIEHFLSWIVSSQNLVAFGEVLHESMQGFQQQR